MLGIARIQDAYLKRIPDYPKGITVPAIVDIPAGEVVTNDFEHVTLDVNNGVYRTGFSSDQSACETPTGRSSHTSTGSKRDWPRDARSVGLPA